MNNEYTTLASVSPCRKEQAIYCGVYKLKDKLRVEQ
jgi:hypothetical protein